MILLSATVTYLNKQILPFIGGVIVAGLTFRIITKLQAAQADPEESMKSAIKKCKKYIFIIIIVILLSSLVSIIDSYFK